MVKVKMFVGKYSADFEKAVNQWLEEHHMFKIVDIKYRRDCKSAAQYSGCIIYDDGICCTGSEKSAPQFRKPQSMLGAFG